MERIMKMVNGMPAVLYKYRGWTTGYGKESLMKRQVYFASPSEFNDPFDCTIPFKYRKSDLTPENIFRKAVETFQMGQPTWSKAKIIAEARRSQLHRLIDDPEHMRNHSELRKQHFEEQFCILSLSADNSNILMWSHYSQSHTGICIGYDTQKLFDQVGGKLGPVIYQLDFPEFGLFDDVQTHFMKYANVKSEDWKYEKEYRAMRLTTNGKVVTLRPDTIREVILGIRMNNSEKKAITDHLKTQYPAISVFHAVVNEREYRIDLKQMH